MARVGKFDRKRQISYNCAMSEAPRPTPAELKLNIQRTPESSPDPDIQAAIAWYKEKLAGLPEMKVEDAPVTDGEKWKAELKDGQIEAVRGTHFAVEGRRVSLPTFSWNQPMIEQARENGISGIILLVKNIDGKYLMTVAQEPGANKVAVNGKETHPVVRTPVQTSVVKLQQLSEGQQEVDPTLYGVLNALSGDGRSMQDIISSIPLREVKTDANRIDSSVVYGVLDVDEQLAAGLEQSTGGKFLTRKQIGALDTVNGHTHVALSAAS